MNSIVAVRGGAHVRGSGADAAGRIAGIDGLRAVAVLSILLFHLDPAWLPGGYMGVDVFYVISGFVVARSVRTLPAPDFRTFAGSFYRRRVLRIFPAVAFFVLIGVLFCALFLPFGPETSNLDIVGLSALAAISNIVLLLVNDAYFQAASSFQPFIHTWSLAVEEQYYLIFPLFAFLLLAQRATAAATRRRTMLILAAISVVSLLACAVLTAWAPDFAFFMLPARFWELGLGLFLYLGVDRIEKTGNRRFEAWGAPLAVAGLAGLAAAFVFAGEKNFPFPWALVPCLATASLIAAITLGRDTIWLRPLAWRPVLWVGALSYSLYLWHWGVIVGMRWTTGVDTPALRLIAVLLIFALSAFSYYRIEQPIRLSRAFKTVPLKRFGIGFAASLGVTAALIFLIITAKPALSLSVTADTQSWLADAMPAERCPADVHRQRVASGWQFDYAPGACSAMRPRQVFFLGDSHARAYRRTAYRLASEAGYRTAVFAMGGCAFVRLSMMDSTVGGCPQFRRQAAQAILARARPGDVVILSALHVPRFRDYWDEPIRPEKSGEFQIHPADRAEAAVAVARLMPLANAGLSILIETPKPVMASANFRCSDWFDRTNAYCRGDIAATRALLGHRSMRANAFLARVAAGVPNSRLWNTFDLLCPGDVCLAWRKGRPLYSDTDHLSAYGNDLVYRALQAELQTQPAKPPRLEAVIR